MAIQRALLTNSFGVPFPDAYWRISRVRITRVTEGTGNKHQVEIDATCFAVAPTDEAAREVESQRFSVRMNVVEDYTGANFITKCYKWMMDQPELSGGVEV